MQGRLLRTPIRTLAEIAAELGLSRERVRQIERDAVARLLEELVVSAR